MKKYQISYCSGATGYGWTHESDRLEEIEPFVDEKRTDYSARVTVWDNSINDFIFYKRALTYTPETDDLSRFDRDYRTKTRRWK